VSLIQSWRLLVGVFDGVVTAYDFQNNLMVCQLPETRGCSSIALNERQSLIYVTLKKKILCFIWQNGNFQPRREIVLNDTPKLVSCIQPNSIVVGFKKTYDLIDGGTATVTRLLDFDREHKNVCLEVLICRII
jgi:hypothetical protein